jgi:hypothetical protein
MKTPRWQWYLVLGAACVGTAMYTVALFTLWVN